MYLKQEAKHEVPYSLSSTMFSAPISSIISTVEPSAVANSKHPFMRNFILPVPDASCPAVLRINPKISGKQWSLIN